MADQRTMAKLLRAPIEGTINLRNEISNFQQRFDESFHEAWDRYKDLLRAFPHHGFTELHKLDTFYNALNLADQDSLNATAGGNLLERHTQDVLTIIENKSKVHNSRNKLVVFQVKSCDANSNSSSEIAKLTHAVNQQTSVVTTAMTAILKQFQATPPPASVKAVEEVCVTCGGAHPPVSHHPFLWTTRALIDVHGEEMILRDGDERLTLNMRHDTSSYSNQPQKESINLINIFKGGNVLPKELLDLDSTKDLHPPLHVNSLSESTTYSSSPNQLLKEFADELARYSLKDSIDQTNLADLNDNLDDSMPEMFTDEHALDYSSPLLFDEYDDDFFKVESDTANIYDDPFDSKGEKIKKSKLLIDELDLPCDFLHPFEYDLFLSEDFFRVDALPSTNNEDNVFNLGILIQENLFEIITRVVQDKKLAISNASLMLEDFNPPFYELQRSSQV
nr:reverse transcriptase domain-containing protein [Tanacetum cinerariifolium]